MEQNLKGCDRIGCQREADHAGDHKAADGRKFGDLISLGTSPEGKDVLVQSGGAIHGAATVESAAALYGLVRTVMESGSASDSETAAFVEPLMGALGDLLGIMRQGQRAGATAAMYRALSGEADSVSEPVYCDQARALGAALRAVRGDA
ncbi:hypothetical protein HTV80_10435 [Streptomyces sp. Vc74B-19]|nr:MULTISPECIES: hypothetical protein [unclassified Streptomyces]MBT3163523.1 hypothetical protein [Streptomyces sp. Vc74B-19]MCO4696934.1 hypothetical protein [Streptomyces sp. RO-S4]MDU0299625.1 hypothetical protein [Streptomyces sp. PAL114]